ncbi:DUF6053 domain-containing protein [Lysobacter enzymogenes]|uniref:DUF6053 domain-containing protein n=1 Tax=Lysobacter enzymogenes TaxID=69 RepID=UPI003D18E99A
MHPAWPCSCGRAFRPDAVRFGAAIRPDSVGPEGPPTTTALRLKPWCPRNSDPGRSRGRR